VAVVAELGVHLCLNLRDQDSRSPRPAQAAGFVVIRHFRKSFPPPVARSRAISRRRLSAMSCLEFASKSISSFFYRSGAYGARTPFLAQPALYCAAPTSLAVPTFWLRKKNRKIFCPGFFCSQARWRAPQFQPDHAGWPSRRTDSLSHGFLLRLFIWFFTSPANRSKCVKLRHYPATDLK
jgi:hypothetical protein